LQVFVGHSDDPDAIHAIADVIEQLERQLDGRTPRAALVYCCIECDHQHVLDAVLERWPGLPLVGCTTDGECSSALEFMEDSVIVTLFEGDELEVRAGLGRSVVERPERAAAEAVAQVVGDRPPSLVIALPESLGVSGARVVRALNAELPHDVPLGGGTAGDQWRFQQTRQFFGSEVLSNAVPLLSLGGRLDVSVGVASGWTPLGRTGTVTRGEGHIVHEIDGAPAIDFVLRNVGIQATATPEYPFAILGDGGDFYLRAPLSSDPSDGSLHFAGDVPEGSRVRVTEAGRDQILEGAEHAARRAFERFDGARATSTLVFSCAARKQVLGTRCREEIDAMLGQGPQATAAGFYTYGEIAPIRQGAPAVFHNETVVATVIGS